MRFFANKKFIKNRLDSGKHPIIIRYPGNE